VPAPVLFEKEFAEGLEHGVGGLGVLNYNEIRQGYRIVVPIFTVFVFPNSLCLYCIFQRLRHGQLTSDGIARNILSFNWSSRSFILILQNNSSATLGFAKNTLD